MRVSEGVPRGRNVYLYHPEIFKDHEEIIIFTKEEFRRNYESIIHHMDYINKEYMFFNRNEDWRLLGIWPKIFERIYLINQHMESMVTGETVQSYLDAYLFDFVEESGINVEESYSKMAVKHHVLGDL